MQESAGGGTVGEGTFAEGVSQIGHAFGRFSGAGLLRGRLLRRGLPGGSLLGRRGRLRRGRGLGRSGGLGLGGGNGGKLCRGLLLLLRAKDELMSAAIKRIADQ